MSDPLPRQRLSAWQRWELASLDGEAAAAPEAANDAAQKAAAQRAEAAERDAIRDAARREGYAAGFAAATADIERLRGLADALGRSAADHEQRIADELLDLALVIARQMVGEALSVRRDFVLPVVTAALKHLPQSTQRIEIKLNPSDLELVRAHVATDTLGARAQLVPDPTQAPGGCRVETEQAEIDTTVESRWARMIENLGRTDDWLAPL